MQHRDSTAFLSLAVLRASVSANAQVTDSSVTRFTGGHAPAAGHKRERGTN